MTPTEWMLLVAMSIPEGWVEPPPTTRWWPPSPRVVAFYRAKLKRRKTNAVEKWRTYMVRAEAWHASGHADPPPKRPYSQYGVPCVWCPTCYRYIRMTERSVWPPPPTLTVGRVRPRFMPPSQGFYEPPRDWRSSTRPR